MATLNISIPASMRKWIDRQVGTGEYANASDYMRDLIRHDQRQHETLKLALIEGERSGTSKKKVKDIIAATKRALKDG
jgi:antitoxin ParD1/3/4